MHNGVYFLQRWIVGICGFPQVITSSKIGSSHKRTLYNYIIIPQGLGNQHFQMVEVPVEVAYYGPPAGSFEKIKVLKLGPSPSFNVPSVY